ncbi:MAG: type II toxin-antitoxin system VapC family toxin [Actinobacteria bacterium]|nr:type II toxin-antitoxin system VapC family toxin [Actinomycetota bacterium]
MITAVDSSVLLDILGADLTFGRMSRDALVGAASRGAVIACDVVWAETAAAFPSMTEAARGLGGLGVDFVALDATCALGAGEAWRSYRKQGGTRQRVIADFLIGAHATEMADRLLTRDRGFYRTYFRKLAIIDPTT